MRILIDALPVTNASGTGYYVQKLLEALDRIATEHEIIAVTPPLNRAAMDHASWPGGDTVQVRDSAPAHPALQAVWRQWRFAALARHVRADLVHYPAFLGCLRCDVPSVVTIPDLVWRLHRDTIPPRKRRYYERVIPRTMARAARIITISDATRTDLAAHYPEYRTKATTVLLGVDRTTFEPVTTETELERVRARYRLPARFVLALSTLEPRKNLPMLIQAFEQLASGLPDLHLVLAGKAGFGADRLRALADATVVRERIVFPGHIAAPDLPVLYSLATVFALPSLNEGFGLPILEAMACGVPVVTSNRSAMSEVAGTAGELVDPDSVESVAHGLRRLLMDTSHYAACVERGLERAQGFSWERTAIETVRVYEDAVG